MAEQILVALKRNDLVEEIIPYVEKVTRAGMEVVFLAPCPVDPLTHWWRDRRISRETERHARLAMNLPASCPLEIKTRQDQEKHFPVCEYSWDNQKRLYREAIFPLCDRLRKKGCEVNVALYTASLRKALRNYALNKDICLIIVRSGISLWSARFFRGKIPSFGVFKRTEGTLMLLLCPDRI